jgi:hypothetical protein
LANVLPSKTQLNYAFIRESIKTEEKMKTIKERILQFVMLGLFGLSCILTVGTLTSTVSANQAKCEYLNCTQPSDCGSKCFCNGPSSACILN